MDGRFGERGEKSRVLKTLIGGEKAKRRELKQK